MTETNQTTADDTTYNRPAYYIKGNNTYHTDKDCHHIQDKDTRSAELQTGNGRAQSLTDKGECTDCRHRH